MLLVEQTNEDLLKNNLLRFLSMISLSPFASVINMTLPPRAKISCVFLEIFFSNKLSLGANTITGTLSSTNELTCLFQEAYPQHV